MTPLVSLVMPTKNRRQWIPRALQCFRDQDYPELELIVVDDGESIADLLPEDRRIKYVRLNQIAVTGTKRNIACKHASGSIIVHWDDDDWYAATRVTKQVAALTERKVTGFSSLIFHDYASSEFWLYRGSAMYVCGTSLCYTRDYWRSNPFPDRQVGEDTDFVTSARIQGQLSPVSDRTQIVASTHSGNTWRRNYSNEAWTRVERPEFYPI